MPKYIAVVKDEFKDQEQKDRWMSFDEEELDHLKARMIRGGSNPDHFNFEG